jgi:hypothetical protein
MPECYNGSNSPRAEREVLTQWKGTGRNLSFRSVLLIRSDSTARACSLALDFPNDGTFPQEIAQRSPHFRRMTPFRDGFDRAQAVAVISVPFATRRTRALPAMETASAILHRRLPA